MPNNPHLYNETLPLLRHGLAAEEASEKLQQCIERARDTGKMATLTVTLKIKPKASGTQCFITDAIKATLPEFDKEETILFPTEDNSKLQRSDPRQTELPGLKEVENPRPTQFKTTQE